MTEDQYEELIAAIKKKESRIAVVGLGYVGLTTACMFANAGFNVTGIDISEERVQQIRAGRWPLDPDDDALPKVLEDAIMSGRLHADSTYEAAAGCEVAILAVPTPIAAMGCIDASRFGPDYTALYEAVEIVDKLARPCLLIIESTVAPGTTDGIASGFPPDVLVAHCPERVQANDLWDRVHTAPRIIGGALEGIRRDGESWSALPPTRELYSAAIGRCMYMHGDHALVAEIMKTAENAHRDVQIAFANELALACSALGADFWSVREAINTSEYHDILKPGPGVGGHCIPKDPWLLMQSCGLDRSESLMRTARRVNLEMPSVVAGLVAEVLSEFMTKGAEFGEEGPIVTLLGASYRRGTKDDRNAPTQRIAGLLEPMCKVIIHDPLVEQYSRASAKDALEGADVAVLVVDHPEYLELDWHEIGAHMANRGLVDTRGVLTGYGAAAFTYRGIGRRNP